MTRRFGPVSRRVEALKSNTLGWSSSKTVTPSGHGNRQDRASRPAARITT